MNNPIKDVKFHDDAKKPLLKGINVVGDAVSSTMGYRGRTVLVESKGGKPEPTKDGVSVAKSIFLDDPVESLGAEFMKQACEKTVSEAGDGTTTTAVLTKTLVNLAEEKLKDGESAIDLKNGIEQAKDEVVEYLKSKSIKVKDEFLFNVAKISSNNDDELGKVISDAFIKAGKNGVVSYEPSPNSKTYVDTIGGMPIERGWDFEGFNNVPEKRAVEFNNKPLILLSNRKIQSIRDIISVLEYTSKSQKELLIISEMEYDVVKTLYANTKDRPSPGGGVIRGMKVAVITPPSIAEKRRDYLTDIRLATGGMVLDVDTSDNIEVISAEALLGTCDRLTVTKDDTVLFFDEKPNQEVVTSKIEELQKVIDNSNNDLEKKYLSDRIAKLACGVSVVNVGASTEAELKEKMDRVDDAIHAVRAALSEGVIQGGGTSLVNASRLLFKSIKDKNDNLKAGYVVVMESILQPFMTILRNAGLTSDDMVEQAELVEEGLGYDVKEYRITNMVESGIIDPIKVVRCALENSVSAATTVLMTDTTVTYKRA